MSKKTPNARKEAARRYAKAHGVNYTTALREVTRSDSSAHVRRHPEPLSPNLDVFARNGGLEGIVGAPAAGKTVLSKQRVVDDSLRGRTQIVVDAQQDYARIRDHAESLGIDPNQIKVIDPAALLTTVNLDLFAISGASPSREQTVFQVLRYMLGPEPAPLNGLHPGSFDAHLRQVMTRVSADPAKPPTMFGVLESLRNDHDETPDGRDWGPSLAKVLSTGRKAVSHMIFPENPPSDDLTVNQGDLVILTPGRDLLSPDPRGTEEDLWSRHKHVVMYLLARYALALASRLPGEWEKIVTIDSLDYVPSWARSADLAPRSTQNLVVRWIAISTESCTDDLLAHTDVLWVGRQTNTRDAMAAMKAAGLDPTHGVEPMIRDLHPGGFLVRDINRRLEHEVINVPENRAKATFWQPSR